MYDVLDKFSAIKIKYVLEFSVLIKKDFLVSVTVNKNTRAAAVHSAGR